MSRFNQKTPGTKIQNLAGGQAHSQSPELELLSILLTSFAKDEFYRSSNDTFSRLISLIIDCDSEFVAKAAVYARTEFGMRSITHVVASELAQHISGKEWAKSFYDKIIYRPDDMMEILSYHVSKNGKIPNAMKKGFAKAFDRFDTYKLAKYRGENKGFKLIDVVNMVHPIPVESNKDAINALVNGELKSFDTWETELSKVGQMAENDGQKAEFKKDVWIKLIRENKLGYFALLRNLRNIIEQAPEALKEALTQLTNEQAIKKSLVLPFRYVTALEQIVPLGKREVTIALNQAIDISCSNVPKFDGDSLVVCDYSGSMGEGYQSYKYKGSLFGAVFAKANNADFMIFGDTAEYVPYNPMDSTLSIVEKFVMQNSGGQIHVGHGTNFHSIFERASKKYDRIIIFSDMQGWMGYRTPSSVFNAWKKSTGSNPFIYSFDLAGYGSMQFPEQNVFCLAGLSEKIFDTMIFMEQDKNALINKIKETKL